MTRLRAAWNAARDRGNAASQRQEFTREGARAQAIDNIVNSRAVEDFHRSGNRKIAGCAGAQLCSPKPTHEKHTPGPGHNLSTAARKRLLTKLLSYMRKPRLGWRIYFILALQLARAAEPETCTANITLHRPAPDVSWNALLLALGCGIILRLLLGWRLLVLKSPLVKRP